MDGPTHPGASGTKDSMATSTPPDVPVPDAASAAEPENTVAAFEAAAAAGADVIELDVLLTSDGVAVVLHDADLSITTDGSGLVHTKTLAEVKRLDASGGRGPRQEIPTLAEALDAAAAGLPGFKPATSIEVLRRVRARDFDPTTRLYAEEGGRPVGYIAFHANGRVSYPWCLAGYEQRWQEKLLADAARDRDTVRTAASAMERPIFSMIRGRTCRSPASSAACGIPSGCG